MKFSILATASLFLATPVTAEFFLKEQFDDATWTSRWTESTSRNKSERGSWGLTEGKNHGNNKNTGLQTSDDARFYGLSAPLSSTFTSADKDLVIQYSVKHEQGIDCGGAYIKLLPGGDKFDSASFGGDSPYGVMFGPDICGGTKRTHVILNSNDKEENLMIKNDIPCESDKLSHLYTLIIRPDNTFEVFVDNKSVKSGDLQDEFDFLEAKEIPDPTKSKPEDWVDNSNIEDPESVKPDGYDDISPEIIDSDASRPDDWDDEDDGEWEAPMIDNPEYEGPWSPKMIRNPDYKGEWKHPKIPNPEYVYNDKMYAVCAGGCTHVGFELWQVKSGSIFDDIIVTDSLEEAQKFAEETFFVKKEGETAFIAEAEERENQEQMDALDNEDPDQEFELGHMGDEF